MNLTGTYAERQNHTQRPDLGGPKIRPGRCPGRPGFDDAVLRAVCRPLLAGEASAATVRPGWTVISPSEYARRTDDCRCFRSDIGYLTSPDDVSDDERRSDVIY